MAHPEEPNYYATSAVAAHQLFQVAMAAEQGPADPVGDITIAHQGPITAVLPTNEVTVDSADAVPDQEPEWLVVVRPEPRMQSVERIARMADEVALGPRREPFVKQPPTSFQARMEAWAGRERGIRSWLGKMALARGMGYDEESAPLVATDIIAQRTLEMNAEFGEIVPPGARPANNYAFTLLRNGPEGVTREGQFNLVWHVVHPNIIPSDQEIAASYRGEIPFGREVPLETILQVGAVLMGGARVLRPEYALELRQRGPQSTIMGAEAVDPSMAAHGVLSNVLGMSADLIAREDAEQQITYMVPREIPESAPGALNVQSMTVVERAATVHPNMGRHSIGDYTSTERSVITDLTLDPIEETDGENLRVRIENLYDLHTGQLTRWRVSYGTSSFSAERLSTGNSNMRGVALPPEQRSRVHAAINAQLQPQNVRDNFERF